MSDDCLGANITETALIGLLRALIEDPVLAAYVAEFDAGEQPVVWLAYGAYFTFALVNGMAVSRRLPHARMPSKCMFVWLAGNSWYDEETCRRLVAPTVKNFRAAMKSAARTAAVSHSANVTRNMAQAGYRAIARRSVSAGTLAALDQWLLEVCDAIHCIAGDVAKTSKL
ncbi:MAG: hypothetical protein KGJ62_15105 [Armatimonadetes bacterium]|nr:hypothetical protein [Armatimonadota bacterium]MDE2206274.1 hypothetical protein [Armatimonadota bacterium]